MELRWNRRVKKRHLESREEVGGKRRYEGKNRRDDGRTKKRRKVGGGVTLGFYCYEKDPCP